eukprot:g12131.t1
MARPSAGGNSSSSAGKKKASAAKKTRGPAPGGKKSKDRSKKTRQRASDKQISDQLKAVKHIKERLKDVVGRFEEAYPDGLDFAPNANDAELA